MDLQRITLDVRRAALRFALVELHPTGDGGVFLKAGMQTSAGRAYVCTIDLTGYPTQMPKVFVTAPALLQSPHRYSQGNLCYLHPNVWNPGKHDIEFVLARAAKWLNKYDVWRETRRWPGAQILH